MASLAGIRAGTDALCLLGMSVLKSELNLGGDGLDREMQWCGAAPQGSHPPPKGCETLTDSVEVLRLSQQSQAAPKCLGGAGSDPCCPPPRVCLKSLRLGKSKGGQTCHLQGSDEDQPLPFSFQMW